MNMIEVMKAYDMGKTIQMRPNGISTWKDCQVPLWNWADFEYRIKLEPKYRPFKTIEEVIGVFGQVAVRNDGSEAFMVNSAVMVQGALMVHYMTATSLFMEEFTINGKPAGVLCE